MLTRLILQVWTSGSCYRASPIPGAEQEDEGVIRNDKEYRHSKERLSELEAEL